MSHTTTEKNLETKPRENLRIRAEKLLTAEGGEFDQISPADVKNLVLELKMRQVQLEMQNEELQRAQETITQARDRYADLYDFAPVGYFTLDRKGKIVEVNLAGARLLGVERDLLVNQSSFRWVAPESREACRTHYRKVFDNQGPQTCEVKLRRRGGPPFYAALETVAAPGEAGAVLHCRTAMSDITGRKQASEEIARLASFPQLNPNPVLEVDNAGNITFTNPAALETARKLGLQDVKSFLPADLREILKATGEQGERQFYREVEIKGTVLAAHIYFVPQFQVTRLFLLDITDRQRAAEELRLAAFKWRTTFDAIGDPVGLMDQEGNILQCNQAMADQVGKPFPEIIGRRCWEVVHGTSGPIDNCPMVRMRQSHQREESVLPVGENWFKVTVDPILDAAGNLTGAVHLIADITRIKRTEEKLLHSLGAAIQRQTEITGLLEASRIVLSETSFEAAVEDIYTFCKSLTGAAAGYVALFTADGLEEQVIASDPGGLPDAVAAALPRLRREMRGEAHPLDRPVWHNDLAHSEWARLLPAGPPETGQCLVYASAG